MPRKSESISRAWSAKRKRKLKIRLSGEQNHLCCLCGWPLDEPPIDGLDPSDWMSTFEHIKPQVEGGRHRVTNLAISHQICNQQKGWKEYANHKRNKRLRDKLSRRKTTAQADSI
jgi:5-methylcytosine-specific restriction endonuclease McrA